MTNRDRILIVALADGALAGRRGERAERRLAAIPRAAEQVERQRRVSRALRAGPATPPTLAAAPAALRAPRHRVFPTPLVAATAVAAVLAALIVIGGGGGTTLTQAAGLAKLSAEQPAPATAGPVLRASLDGVTFPEWYRKFGWRATGARSDTLNGRRTRTVYYEHTGHRIAYTIVSGPPLELPDHVRHVRRDGLSIALYRDASHGGHDIAVFERNGRTCVLAGHVMRVSTLVKLAAWKGGGEVRS